MQDAIEGKHPEFRNDFRIVNRQGELRWLQGIGRVDRNAEGEVVRMSGVNLDITPRTHHDGSVTLALKVADRGYVLESGKIVHDDSAEALAHDPALEAAYLGKTEAVN